MWVNAQIEDTVSLKNTCLLRKGHSFVFFFLGACVDRKLNLPRLKNVLRPSPSCPADIYRVFMITARRLLSARFIILKLE